MWKTLQISPPYFLNVSNDIDYRIFITDYIKIWSVYYSEGLFINCLMESNFGLEIDRQELLDRGRDILLKPEELNSLEISRNNSNLHVSMTMSFGYPLTLDLKLVEGSNELKITQSLLKTIHDLKESENELRSLLLKKDDEIIEYKSQGGKIKYTALPPYKDNEHMNKHGCFQSYFDSNQVPGCILEKTINCIPEYNVKQEPIEGISVKTESSSEMINSNGTTNSVSTSKEESVKTEFKPFVPKKKLKRLNI